MKRNKIIQPAVFFVIGVLIFGYIYKDLKLNEIRVALQGLKYEWIFISIIFGLLSQLVRAIRWKMLIRPLNYNPGIKNLFLSVLILYFMNLLIPRGGEVVRCGVITKYEKISFTRLLGTVITERFTDLFTFLFIMIIVVSWQMPFFKTLLSNPEFNFDITGLKNKIFLIIGIILLGAILFLIIKKLGILKKFKKVLKKIRIEFTEGLSSILIIKRKGLFIIDTILIFVLWLVMLYVMFLAYPPTAHLNFKIAVVVYTVGTLAYLLPIQAGIGAWHFLIIQCLFVYGIDKETGKLFALIAHTFTNLIYLVFGTIAFILLPVLNNNNEKEHVER